MSSWRDAAPPVPPIRGDRPPRIPEEVLDAFIRRSTADIADLVGPLYALDPAIRPLHRRSGPIAGAALTVKAVPADNRAILAALSLSGPGDILVVDWRGYVGACGSGGKAVAGPHAAGLRGIVVDGAWRDIPELETLGMPIFGRGESLISPAKSHLGEIDVPVHCGGVVVAPGDLVVADGGGVVVVPRRWIDAVLHELPEASSVEETIEVLQSRSSARRAAYLEAFEAAGGVSG